MTSAERFLARLRKLDAAGKAALRSSATRPHEPDTAAHDAFTAAWWPIRHSSLPRDPCRLVASLYFWNPRERSERDTDDEDSAKRVDLVGSLRIAARFHRRLDPKRTEQLVNDLLAASLSALPDLLLVVVRRLAEVRERIDWPHLLRDLHDWDRGGDNSVQDRWANSWLQHKG